MTGAKLKRTDLTAFLSAAAELCTQALLCQYGRHPAKIYEEMAEKLAKSLTKEQLAGIIEILRSDLDESAFNVGVGHMLGALAARLSAFLSASGRG